MPTAVPPGAAERQLLYRVSATSDCKFVRWDAPFADAERPSVYVLGDEQDDSRSLTVLVAPGGTEVYPKYLVRFSVVYAYLSEEEGRWFKPHEQPEPWTLPRDARCAFLCTSGSEWWAAYGGQFLDLEGVEPAHFVLLGGDNEVEVFAATAPEIEMLSSPGTLTLTHAV